MNNMGTLKEKNDMSSEARLLSCEVWIDDSGVVMQPLGVC